MRHWRDVIEVHESAAANFVALLHRIPQARWHQPSPGRKWSPADEAVHVALSYDMALASLTRGASMQPRVSAGRARLLRWLVLPVIVRSDWFPRASAPEEVRPSEPEARAATIAGTAARIEGTVSDISAALNRVDAAFRFQHAYFGSLTPRAAIRLLAAHTRHHARTLARHAMPAIATPRSD